MSRTSTEVKRRYNDKTYSHINVAIPKETAQQFRETCDRKGVSQASVIKTAIEDFIEKERE